MAILMTRPHPRIIEGWKVSTAVYSTNKSLVAQENSARGIVFSPDGTYMFYIGINNNTVYRYTLSTPYLVSSASFDTGQTFNVLTYGGEDNPQEVQFSRDGMNMYITGYDTDKIIQYYLSTAWDLTTCNYTRKFSCTSQENATRGVTFGDSGTKCYVCGEETGDVFQYTLTTAWDASTGSYSGKSYSFTEDIYPGEVRFNNDGSKMYMCGRNGTPSRVYEYSLSTAWDVNSASNNDYLDVNSEEQYINGFDFSTDGTKLYIIGADTDTVYQYTLSTAWDVSSGVYSSKSLSCSSQISHSPTSVTLGDNGTKCYVCENDGDIFQYNLSTAWDISTGVYAGKTLNTFTEEASLQGLVFNDDGKNLYVVGPGTNVVHQYPLTTAYDLSTAHYKSELSVSAKEGATQSLFLKSDGTEIYISGDDSDSVHQYTLATAFDITSGTFTASFLANSQTNHLMGLTFSRDGSKMYISGLTGANSTSVFQYRLSTQWDLTTCVYTGLSFAVTTQEYWAQSITFNKYGTKMYSIGNQNNTVSEYTITD